MEDATTDEAADCRWMTISEIRKLYENNELVQTLDYFFCIMEADVPDYSHIIGKKYMREIYDNGTDNKKGVSVWLEK